MQKNKTTAGLRVDVDTLRGTKLGVPNLLALFERHNIKATFFFSVGPDNMGRHVKRLLHPAFFFKMVRSNAPSLYGWDILLKGTLWPGPVIGNKAAGEIRAAAAAGHEIGLHAWDHHQWQSRIGKMSENKIQTITDKGMEMLHEILGRPVDCMAAPAWKITANGLHDRDRRELRYCTDCRGRSIFYPTVDGKTFTLPQIPSTLPTYDELISRDNINHQTYNEYLLTLFNPDRLNVLTIHAEVEGRRCFELFQQFLVQAKTCHISFCTLGKLLEQIPAPVVSGLRKGKIEGREGWLSCQEGRNGE